MASTPDFDLNNDNNRHEISVWEGLQEIHQTRTKYGYGKEQRERKVVINQTKEDHIQEEHHSVEDILPFKATQIDKGEEQGNPIQRNTAAEPSTYSRKPRIQWLPSDDKGWETFDEDLVKKIL